MKVEYPKFLYHAELSPCVVKSAEEHAALGAGWCESPADVAKAPPPEPAPIKVELVNAAPKKRGRPKASKA